MMVEVGPGPVVAQDAVRHLPALRRAGLRCHPGAGVVFSHAPSHRPTQGNIGLHFDQHDHVEAVLVTASGVQERDFDHYHRVAELSHTPAHLLMHQGVGDGF